ncbi:MAG: SCO family protein [Candidatus Margulisiibacteriota bacterium]
MGRLRTVVCSVVLCLLLGLPVVAKEPLPKDLVQVGVSENLGAQLPLQTEVITQAGKTVQFKSLLPKNKPVLFCFAYYRCPMLCNLLLTGVADAIKETPLKLGTDYDVVTLSIDPTDTPESAAAFRDRYISTLGKTANGKHWTFLVAQEPAITALAKAAGFNYKFNPDTNEYAHSAVILMLTPEGKVSRYLYGIQFKPFDVKMGLLEAKDKKLVSTVERVLLFCYNYDHASRGYVLQAMNVMKLGGLVTILALLTFIIVLLRKEKSK